MNVSDYFTEWTEWAEVSSHCSVTVDSMIESLLGQSCSNTLSISYSLLVLIYHIIVIIVMLTNLDH